LIGGPAFCGTTLLTVMLNQNGVCCLHEPDFHVPEQSHNGLPVLQRLYPHLEFPERTPAALTFPEAFELMQRCQSIVRPDHLGFKFCNLSFTGFAQLFRAAKLPVVAIVRDVRDALVRPLKPHVGGESGLVRRYRQVWEHRDLCNAIIRYEDLVQNPSATIGTVAAALGIPLHPRANWDPREVSDSMLYPEERHLALRSGTIATDRVGIWRSSGKSFDLSTHALARDMGYSDG